MSAFGLETAHRHPDPDDRESRDLPWDQHICVDHRAHTGKARDCMVTYPVPNTPDVLSERDRLLADLQEYGYPETPDSRTEGKS